MSRRFRGKCLLWSGEVHGHPPDTTGDNVKKFKRLTLESVRQGGAIMRSTLVESFTSKRPNCVQPDRDAGFSGLRSYVQTNGRLYC